ncbi:toxin [Arcanobacterium hippocoleae]|uniref:toxin n=1 Tax=Arcanobacterium hippocoleae TaxID=149017 RepID=UPI00333E2672
MSISIHDSARKHGIADQDSLQAATWPLWIEPLDEDSPQRELRLGFDTSGRLLEVVALVFDSGNEMIIHAMKARPQYISLLP